MPLSRNCCKAVVGIPSGSVRRGGYLQVVCFAAFLWAFDDLAGVLAFWTLSIMQLPFFIRKGIDVTQLVCFPKMAWRGLRHSSFFIVEGRMLG